MKTEQEQRCPGCATAKHNTSERGMQFCCGTWLQEGLPLRSPVCYASENAALKEALENDRSKWSFDTLVYVACEILKEPYPRTCYFVPNDETGQAFVELVRKRLECEQ